MARSKVKHANLHPNRRSTVIEWLGMGTLFNEALEPLFILHASKVDHFTVDSAQFGVDFQQNIRRQLIHRSFALGRVVGDILAQHHLRRNAKHDVSRLLNVRIRRPWIQKNDPFPINSTIINQKKIKKNLKKTTMDKYIKQINKWEIECQRNGKTKAEEQKNGKKFEKKRKKIGKKLGKKGKKLEKNWEKMNKKMEKNWGNWERIGKELEKIEYDINWI